MKIDVAQRAGNNVLAGIKKGEMDLVALAADLDMAQADELVEVDLSGVHVLTGSYFNAGILPLWDRARDKGCFPVLRGVSDTPRADIEIVLNGRNRAIWATPATDRFDDAAALGPVDSGLQAILDRARSGAVSAVSLYEGDRSIGATAWSNRLAQLHGDLLLRRTKEGRKFLYTVPWAEV